MTNFRVWRSNARPILLKGFGTSRTKVPYVFSLVNISRDLERSRLGEACDKA